MKKAISILLAVAMIISLAGCGGKNSKFLGTWKAESVEVDGTKYTVSELKAMGGDDLSEAKIVIKDGGKAYISDSGVGDVVSWEIIENGIRIGESDCTVSDNMICIEHGEGKVYFAKVSKDQTFGNEQTDQSDEEDETQESSVVIKNSPDKYTWYIKDYAGKNCASVGYTSLGGDRMDTYGDSLVKLIFVSSDGTYIDPESEEELKNYVVTGQNIAPNSEQKLIYEKDSKGVEYDSLVLSQSYEEIVLSVKKVNSIEKEKVSLTTINPSPDKYTRYISEYKGRNLASCGYTSIGGNLMDSYGEALIKLTIVSENGAFVDPNDEDALKGYIVTKQNIAPNTALKITFDKDDKGKEYDNLVETQSIEEIELTVKAVNKK